MNTTSGKCDLVTLCLSHNNYIIFIEIMQMFTYFKTFLKNVIKNVDIKNIVWYI